MAFPQPNSRGKNIYEQIKNVNKKLKIVRLIFISLTELQNRKILEELQLKKQMLLKQGVASSLGTSLSSTPASSNSVSTGKKVLAHYFHFFTLI